MPKLTIKNSATIIYIYFIFIFICICIYIIFIIMCVVVNMYQVRGYKLLVTEFPVTLVANIKISPKFLPISRVSFCHCH